MSRLALDGVPEPDDKAFVAMVRREIAAADAAVRAPIEVDEPVVRPRPARPVRPAKVPQWKIARARRLGLKVPA